MIAQSSKKSNPNLLGELRFAQPEQSQPRHPLHSVVHHTQSWDFVSIRLKFDMRQVLRATLQGLEQTLHSAEHAQAMDELKRILLNRIAELDAAEVPEKAAEVNHPGTGDRVPE